MVEIGEMHVKLEPNLNRIPFEQRSPQIETQIVKLNASIRLDSPISDL